MTETDLAERLRMDRLRQINARPEERAELEARFGRVWDSRELERDFVPVGFLAPYVVARRKADGVLGSLEFQHQPRFYFNWKADE